MRLFDFCLALARLVTVYIVPQKKLSHRGIFNAFILSLVSYIPKYHNLNFMHASLIRLRIFTS